MAAVLLTIRASTFITVLIIAKRKMIYNIRIFTKYAVVLSFFLWVFVRKLPPALRATSLGEGGYKVLDMNATHTQLDNLKLGHPFTS